MLPSYVYTHTLTSSLTYVHASYTTAERGGGGGGGGGHTKRGLDQLRVRLPAPTLPTLVHGMGGTFIYYLFYEPLIQAC